jgi:hypothetical protein
MAGKDVHVEETNEADYEGRNEHDDHEKNDEAVRNGAPSDEYRAQHFVVEDIKNVV